MDNRQLLTVIKKTIEENPTETKRYSDYFSILRVYREEVGYKRTKTHSEWLKNAINEQIKKCDTENIIDLFELLKKCYLFDAKDDFASYMIYLEWDRKPEDKFYQPRARRMKSFVDGIQALVDDGLDELFISMPPRVGKTTLLMFLMTWIIGRTPELSNLYSAFSDIITNAFYNGVLEVLQDSYTYKWADVFPDMKIAFTNAKEETLDIDRKKRYHSLTSRSLYGTLNGACDCNGFLISDDLIGGIEEALNKDRLVSAWTKVDNNLLPRAKMSAKILWCGTRWSNADPAGLRMDILQTDKRFDNRRYKIINIPALNEQGESNFDYAYGVGFSSEYYHQRKASFEKQGDLPSWNAQYMGQPTERTGTLFEPSEMKYFNGELPDESTLLRKFVAVDPAFGGGDYVAAPFCYQFESGIYIVDVVYSNADKKFTQSLLKERIIEWGIQAAQFECNRSTAAYKEKVEEMLFAEGYRLNITYKSAPPNTAKEIRIFDKASEIKEFYFLEGRHRSKEYDQFMTNVFSFQINGNNKHDDAPDSLAMLVDMIENGGQNIKIKRRMF